MYYAHISDGQITEIGQPPRQVPLESGDPATRLTEVIYVDLTDRNPETLAEHGWFAITESPQPADTATGTHEPSVQLDEAGLPVEVWTFRPWTAIEQAAIDAAAARAAARAIVKQIVTDLQAEKVRAQAVIDKSNASITGADTKDIARAAKRIADAAIDLARFVQDNP